jgi:hypothetical protein
VNRFTTARHTAQAGRHDAEKPRTKGREKRKAFCSPLMKAKAEESGAIYLIALNPSALA